MHFFIIFRYYQGNVSSTPGTGKALNIYFFFFSGIVEYSRKKYTTHGQTDVTTPISIQLLKFPSYCDLTSQIITPTSYSHCVLEPAFTVCEKQRCASLLNSGCSDIILVA